MTHGWLIYCNDYYIKNHGVTLYPHWSNASDFKDTDKSFDTVALHSSDLHQALENRCDRISWKNIKLTREQKAISRAQGVKLCTLPFATIEEKTMFTRSYSIVSKKQKPNWQYGGATILMKSIFFLSCPFTSACI